MTLRRAVHRKGMADADLERWHIRVAPDTWIGRISMRSRRRAGHLAILLPRVPRSASERVDCS